MPEGSLALEPFITCSNSKNAEPEEGGRLGERGCPAFLQEAENPDPWHLEKASLARRLRLTEQWGTLAFRGCPPHARHCRDPYGTKCCHKTRRSHPWGLAEPGLTPRAHTLMESAPLEPKPGRACCLLNSLHGSHLLRGEAKALTVATAPMCCLRAFALSGPTAWDAPLLLPAWLTPSPPDPCSEITSSKKPSLTTVM